MDVSAMDHHTPVIPLGLQTYLVQWLQVATSGNVRLSYITHGTVGKNFLHFKCDRCGDNLNQELGTFKGFANGIEAVIPSELQDWVGKHLHPNWVQYGFTYTSAPMHSTAPAKTEIKTIDPPKGRKFRD